MSDKAYECMIFQIVSGAMDKMNLITRQPAYSWSPVHRTQKQPGDYEYIYDRATGEHVARKVDSQPMQPRFTEHGVKQ